MKKALIFAALMFSLVTFALAASEMKGISAQHVSGKPDVFCKVTKEPDQLLLGDGNASTTSMIRSSI